MVGSHFYNVCHKGISGPVVLSISTHIQWSGLGGFARRIVDAFFCLSWSADDIFSVPKGTIGPRNGVSNLRSRLSSHLPGALLLSTIIHPMRVGPTVEVHPFAGMTALSPIPCFSRMWVVIAKQASVNYDDLSL